MWPACLDEGMNEGVSRFFLFVIAIGGEAKIAVAVHENTTPIARDSMILRRVYRPAHIEVAGDVGSNDYSVAGDYLGLGDVSDADKTFGYHSKPKRIQKKFTGAGCDRVLSCSLG